MKKYFLPVICFVAIITTAGANDVSRQRLLFDDDWRFTLSDPVQAAAPGFDDSLWRKVNLPHDWSIEGMIDRKASMGGGGGFFPAGIGWYRKQFNVPADWRGRRVEVEFEGVYMNVGVYLNGQKLDTHPYGYTTFFVDLMPALKPGTSNVLAVRVDNSEQKNSRWYAGSGIYRHVWLQATGPVHVADWGNFIFTTQAVAESALVTMQTKVMNETAQPLAVKLHTEIIGPDGNSLGASDVSCDVAAEGAQSATENMVLKNPPLWSPDLPQMSRAITRVLVNNEVVDTVTNPFGIRDLKWSASNGLTINGKIYKLKGGCIHGDNGVLGVAAFDRAEERKIELLKAAGFNAIRTAHNPPSPALLAACDRLGMLVLDEVFDCWTVGKNSMDYHIYFKDWWQRDLDSMVLRDRNHPSIIMWNIGNEIPGIFNSDKVAAYGPELTDEIHSLDKTRPVTDAILGWPVKPSEPQPTDAHNMKNADLNWNHLDIVGSNYQLGMHVKQHNQYPERILVSTESYPPLGEPRAVLENSFVLGDFVWAAQDYFGEAGVGRWFYEGDPTEPMSPGNVLKSEPPRPIGHGSDQLYPWHGANPGLLDILGNAKPALSYWNVVWKTGLKLGIGVRQPQGDKKIIVAPWGWYPTWHSWTWPGWEGRMIEVEVYSIRTRARLFLNGIRIGEELTKGGRAIFKVPYQPGILKASGLDENGREMETLQLATVGNPVSIRLTPDRSDIKADGQDLSFVKVEVLDENENLQPNTDQLIHFTLTGPGTIAGLGNANLKSKEPYQGVECHVFHGTALIVLRSSEDAGDLRLKADAAGLSSAETLVKTE